MKSLLLLSAAMLAASLPLRRDDLARPPGEHDWAVDPVHSSVMFRVKHANAAFFKGMFETIEGKVTIDPADPAAGSVELTIPVASIDSNSEPRDDHLKGPDFFNAKENPTISFRSTKIVADGDSLLVTGELSMAGKQQTITIPVEKTGEGEFRGKRVGYTTTFAVQRSQFGMTYGVAKNVLGDEVTLMIDLELVQS